MGSYALYGSTTTAGVMIYDKTPVKGEVMKPVSKDVADVVSTPAAEEGPTFLGGIFDYLTEHFINVVDGKIFIGDVSALEVGSIILIVVSLYGAITKSYYDFTDWQERKRARARQQLAEDQEALNEESATLGADSPPIE